MKVWSYVFIAFLYFVLGGFEVQAAALPAEATYQQELNSQAGKKNLPTWIDVFFDHRKTGVFKSEGLPNPRNPLDWVDRIYSTSDLKKLVLIKTDVQLSKEIELDKLYKEESDFLVHMELEPSQVLAFYLVGFDESNARVLIDDLRKKRIETSQFWDQSRSFTKMAAYWLLTSSKALAEESPSFNCRSKAALSPQEIKDLHSDKSSWECVKGIAGGMWNGSVGAVMSTGKGVISAVTSPVETFKKAKSAFNGAIALSQDFTNQLGDLKSAFLELPAPVRSKLICEVGASIGTSALLSFVTFGGAGPQVYRALANAIDKVYKAKNSYRHYAPLYITTRQSGALAKKLHQKADQKELVAYLKPDAKKNAKLLKKKMDRYVQLSKEAEKEKAQNDQIPWETIRGADGKETGFLTKKGAKFKAQNELEKLSVEITSLKSRQTFNDGTKMDLINEDTRKFYHSMLGTMAASGTSVCHSFATFSKAQQGYQKPSTKYSESGSALQKGQKVGAVK